MTKILFIDDGIEFDSEILRKKPLGGAEVAFVSLVEELANLGYEVVVRNNCTKEGLIKNVLWKKLNAQIYEEKFDVVVINRGDKFLNFRRDCKKRIFWIHNPASYLLKYRYLSKLFLNKAKIVFSSQYHKRTYPWWAPSKERIVIPYGVDNSLFINKKKRSCPRPHAIFTSNAMRGLEWLLELWVTKIHPNVKDGKLHLYTGSSTYGKYGQKHLKTINRIIKKAESFKNKGVILNSPVTRSKLFQKIKNSRVFLYQGSDDETFCMSAAESQVLKTPGIVKNYGSLSERIIHNKTGYICNNDKEFCLNTIKLLNDNNLWMKMHKNLLITNNHHTWSEVAKKWTKIID
ncbi:MAG: hypothetical protein CMP32_03180 [Rickettsiales bacterium]|nr:hypothetical protein [Rickettsiales bacterium]